MGKYKMYNSKIVYGILRMIIGQKHAQRASDATPRMLTTVLC